MKYHKQLALVCITSLMLSFFMQAHQSNTYSNTSQSSSKTTEDSFEKLFNEANKLFVEKKYDEAIELYKKSAELTSHYQVFFNLGCALHQSKQYKEALRAYVKTISLKDDYIPAYINMCKLLITVKKAELTVEPLKKVLILNPNCIEAYIILGHAYGNMQQFKTAIATFKQGLQIDPENIALLFELANTYNISNDLENALQLYTKLSKQSPHNTSFLYNTAHTLKKLGRIHDAMPYYEKTLSLEPEHAEALFSRGLAYLMLGDYEKGWDGYEWRFKNPKNRLTKSYLQPHWDGSDLHNKTLFLYAEQGLGDTFQFIRYAQVAKEKGGTVIVAVQGPLVQLMRNCPYIDTVISQKDTPPPFDVHASLMSMPYLCKTRLNTVPNTLPYIFPDPERVTYWKEKVSNDKNFKIGICWHANNAYGTTALRAIAEDRSIHVSHFAPLWNIEGVSVYSLQQITGLDQLNELDNHKLITFDTSFDNDHGRFIDTTALIQNLDLVISVDTSIGHCAGALDAQTWLLLPKPHDWRWLIDQDSSPWYPHTRLFKQTTIGDWSEVIERIVKDVKHIVKKHGHKHDS